MNPLARALGTLTLLLIAVTAKAQPARGLVREGLTMPSAILGAPVRYTIYLPPGYETSQRAYPVVYLLHGYTDDDTAWIQFGEADRIADAALAAGEIPPMILVMPDGGLSWFINDHGGRVRWEDMFVEEFIPHVETTYRVRRQRQYRGISGESMGGYGALALALRHPDLFVAVAAFGSALRTDDEMSAIPQDRYDEVFGPVYGRGLSGAARFTDHWRRYSALDLALTLPAETLRRLRYYLDCGDDDHLGIGNATLHIRLKQRGIPHEYRMRDGGHTWSYWRSALPAGLRFLGESFRK
ncbi:MAG TPA: alpha/beta hydrolase family protein [Rhodothermales bacterium]|nr:alpha/beta hydrolase family protein [Rhodothermales bacterium]